MAAKAFGAGVLVGTSALVGYYFGLQDKDKLHDSGNLKIFSKISKALSNRHAEEDYTKWNYNWDHKLPEKLVKPLRHPERADAKEIAEHEEKVKNAKAKVSRILVLIRHGQYDQSVSHNDGGQLTEVGKEQARLTGERLKVLLDEYLKDENDNRREDVDLRLIYSTMPRATETAQIILNELKDERISIEKSDMIREGAPIPPQPPIAANLWNPDPKTFFEDGARIEAAFRKFIQRPDAHHDKEQVDILVCHGNVIRYFLCRALQFAPDAWLRFALHNGSITTLYIRPSGRVGVVGIGEAGYMPKDKLTFN